MYERRECGEPHARARSPGRRARAHDMRVNGPPKSAPSSCGGAAGAPQASSDLAFFTSVLDLVMIYIRNLIRILSNYSTIIVRIYGLGPVEKFK
jgi:hypothetical protein